MSDLSHFSLFTAGLACLIPFANAFTYNTQPIGDLPSGNPISQPGLNSVVSAGGNFTITWNPTSPGNVDLVLLKGPATNAVPQETIASNIPNTGTYVWLPSTDLAPSDPSTPAQGYGIQLIVDATGAYQYTTQFGISNSAFNAPSISSSSSALASAISSVPASPTSAPWGYSRPESVWYGSEGASSYTSHYSHGSSTAVANVTATAVTVSTDGPVSGGSTWTSGPILTAVPVFTGTATSAHSANFLVGNSSIILPTGSLTVPSSLLTSVTPVIFAPVTNASATSSVRGATSAALSASPTGGASANLASSSMGLIVAAGVAAFAVYSHC